MKKIKLLSIVLLVFVCIFIPITKSSVIKTFASSDKRAEIDIVYNGRHFRYTDELIIAPDHLVAETIHKRKINAELDDKVRQVERCITAGASMKDAILYCFPNMYKTIDKVLETVNVEPVSSTITFSPDKKPMFTITKDNVGYRLDENKLYQDIYYNLRKNSSVKIIAKPIVLKPEVTVQDNISLTALRARYTTQFPLSSQERKNNIKLALSFINGRVLKKDEEFSFNKTVGRRSEERGFKTSKIIVKGEYTDGIGGGICQASTALYNCALRADLNITEARNHSLLPSYVEPSLDAMVSFGSSDLKFKNSGETPVFIRAVGVDSEAIIEIYGKPLPYTITTESNLLFKGEIPEDKEVIDTELKYTSESKVGEKVRVTYSHPTVKSESFLIYKDKKGKVVNRKLLRKDTYNSVQGIIAIRPSSTETQDSDFDNVSR